MDGRRRDSSPGKLCSYGNSLVNLPTEQLAAVSNYGMGFDSLPLTRRRHVVVVVAEHQGLAQ